MIEPVEFETLKSVLLIVAERWKGGRFPFEGQSDREVVTLDQIPTELQVAMKSVSRAKQEMFQQQIEKQFVQ